MFMQFKCCRFYEPIRIHGRLLISQDRDGIYLTFARYNQSYLAYLLRAGTPTQSFLWMECYGPWRISNADNMKQLG